MDDEVQYLVLTPFKEIVEKGKTALANALASAGDTEPPRSDKMHNAAKDLVKEGERAVKRIEPLCKKYWDNYGYNFVDALKENNEIASFRTELNDILWEFDSYVEADGFDAGEFAKLQALSRKAAPKIYDVLTRMKLEHRQVISDSGSADQQRAVSPAPIHHPDPSVDDEISQPHDLMCAKAGPDLGLNPAAELAISPLTLQGPEASATAHLSADSVRPEEIPPEPPFNPWQEPAPPIESGNVREGTWPERRPFVSTNELASEPVTVPAQSGGLDHGIEVVTVREETAQEPQTVSVKSSVARVEASGSRSPEQGSQSRSPLMQSVVVNGIPGVAATPQRNSNASYITTSSAQQSLFGFSAHGSTDQGDQSGSIDQDDQPGLILAQEGSSAQDESLQIREPDCTITIGSSFYQLKGFCDGAKDIISGGVGIRKVRKAGIGAGNTTVAKCKCCMYELDWKQVELDINNSESANHVDTGVRFRLRFLSKSHLRARTIDDRLYGCLFCIEQGRTAEESDATVFFSAKQLFSHLARHPRPLPPVSGLTVIEGAGIPETLRNNFDLHFTEPPASPPTALLRPHLLKMPIAVATETFRATNNAIRKPPGHTEPLQFAVGAKIIVVNFPDKYRGEWAVGWTDNVFGPFPTECVRLEPPDPALVKRKQVLTGIRGVAKWKRQPKDKDLGGWLKFDRDEVITNISYSHPEDWCWYGCNSRGKWGIFPQSHIVLDRPSEVPGLDWSGIESKSKHGGGGVLAKLSSIRRQSARPTSSAGSFSSNDTAIPHSPGKSWY